MYDLLLVRRRRRRKIAALVSLFSSMGITSLIIVSFLGQNTGTFTVSITNSTVKLSLCKKSTFAQDERTTYLRIDKLDQFEEYTYTNVLFDDLDDENKEFNYGAQDVKDKDGKTISVLPYLKYTFYVGNMGNKAARYTLNVNLLECTASLDGRTLDDTLRVMVYENDINDSYGNIEHNVAVYAKETSRTNKDIDGNPTKREFISRHDRTYTETENFPLATSFDSLKRIAKYDRGGFYSGQIRRYTLVTWLEGEDDDSLTGEGEPIGASLKLGVEITAYENE